MSGNNSQNQIKGGVILSYASIIVSNAVGLVYTPVMLRLLGQSEYGLYSLVASVVSYLGLLNFGFDSAYLRYYTQCKETQSQERVATLNGMFLIVFAVISIVVMAAGVVLCGNAAAVFGNRLTEYELDTAEGLLVLLVINISITFATKIFSIYINANERFIFAKTLNMARTITGPFVSLPLLLAGCGSYALIMSTLVISVLVDIINIWYCIKILRIRFQFSNMEFSLLKEVFIFSLFVFIGEIVDEINWQLDKFLLGRFCGTVAVATYAVAASLSSYYRQFSVAISGVFGPRVNRIVATTDDDAELTNVMIKVGRIQYIVLSLVAVAFVFVGRGFCILWAGEDYVGSYVIAVVLILPSTIPLIQNVGISILTARNKHKFRSLVYLLFAIINLAVSIPLCQAMEGLGCAIGTAISMVVGNGLIINLYYRKIGIDVAKFWKSILSLSKGLVPMITIGMVMQLLGFDTSWPSFIIQTFVLCLCFSVGMYFFGMNFEEKKYVDRTILKLCRKKT